MKCPHCATSVHPGWIEDHVKGVSAEYGAPPILKDRDGSWSVKSMKCPACDRSTIILRRQWRTASPGGDPENHDVAIMAWPRGVARPLPPEVSKDFVADYQEAGLVLDAGSPKASAALSRRCLQRLLREKAGTKSKDLADQIDEVLPTVPSHHAEAIDAVRTIGNFAAHPIKSTNTGEIIDVEPGEAEWLLETLEGLLDHYFVQPAKLAAKKAALNSKLTSAGKPPLKTP